MTGPAAYLGFLRENAAFLSAGVLICFTSSYGQTFFISLFAADIMRDFDLSDGDWGLVYTVATTLSAGLMVFAGGLTDRLRVRQLAMVAAIGLALACLSMASVSGAAALTTTVLALRLFGQGLMSHISAVAMSRWFIATRGKALSISSMGFALGQATLPIVFVALLAVFDWRVLWVGAAGLVLMSMPVTLRLLRAERTPQSLATEASAVGMDGRHWTRGAMLRHWLFWMLIPLLLGPPAFGTALFFHQVHLTDVKGWDLLDYVALMPIFTIVSVSVTFASGALIDRFGTGVLIAIYLLPFAAAFVLIGAASSLVGAAVGLMVLGIGTGAQATVPTAFWAEYYGTRHLGSLKAMAVAIMVLGSAIGPGLTGLLIDKGFDFPAQMPAIAAYFLLSAILAAAAVLRARKALTPQIDIIGA
ncbi:MFS transporter [Jannaschia donghaensis]|uniref:MFS transporter n=1 Tax=Jannaschia donghaensis TaxID=420998 RepID=UPI0006D8496E|nr:MFS transporter [Jannaschia donghaensis]